jgi:hypothetical protein
MHPADISRFRSRSRLWPALFVAAVAAVTARRAQAQTCTSVADCETRDAQCVNQTCRLATPQPLIPSLTTSPIDLQQPGELGVVTTHQPDLRFTFPPGASTVNVLIANKPPNYDVDGHLANPEAIVWFWSSRWAGTATGTVAYGQGRLISMNGDMCSQSPATPLEPGTYYWAAIGFDAAGKLAFQSVLRPFAVDSESTTGRFCNDVRDCGPVGATVCTDPNHYCVMACASDLDCFEGTLCTPDASSSPGFPWGLCRPADRNCPCAGSDQRCDDTGAGALQLCYVPAPAAQHPEGCDCNSSSPTPNACYAAMLAGCVFTRRRRNRPSRG